jgi:hypothetical protein
VKASLPVAKKKQKSNNDDDDEAPSRIAKDAFKSLLAKLWATTKTSFMPAYEVGLTDVQRSAIMRKLLAADAFATLTADKTVGQTLINDRVCR